jgi:hypothetical protein
MSIATRPHGRQEILRANFLERAQHYHFAAAMSQSPYEIERFCEIADMFELMAREIQPWSLGSGFASVSRRGDQSRFGNANKTLMTWLGGIVGAMRNRLTAMRKCLPKVRGVETPIVVSALPNEICTAPRRWSGRAHPKLIHYNKFTEQMTEGVEQMKTSF